MLRLNHLATRIVKTIRNLIQLKAGKKKGTPKMDVPSFIYQVFS
jgi:hypothetical protein